MREAHVIASFALTRFFTLWTPKQIEEPTHFDVRVGEFAGSKILWNLGKLELRSRGSRDGIRELFG